MKDRRNLIRRTVRFSHRLQKPLREAPILVPPGFPAQFIKATAHDRNPCISLGAGSYILRIIAPGIGILWGILRIFQRLSVPQACGHTRVCSAARIDWNRLAGRTSTLGSGHSLRIAASRAISRLLPEEGVAQTQGNDQDQGSPGKENH